MWAHPPASIPAKEGRSLLEVLVTSSPSHPHPQLVMVVQSGLSQQQEFTGLAGEVKPVLAPALAVPQTARHSWDKPGGISSATDGKVDKKNSFRNIQAYLGWPGFPTQHRNSPCHCQAVDTLPSWRAKHIGADSSWKT